MPEPFDVYTDAFVVTITPFGTNMSFQLKEAHPTPGTIGQPSLLGTIRMSNEHLKTMAFILRRHLIQYEQSLGTRCEVPRQILSQLQIAPEDWDTFWQDGGT